MLSYNNILCYAIVQVNAWSTTIVIVGHHCWYPALCREERVSKVIILNNMYYNILITDGWFLKIDFGNNWDHYDRFNVFFFFQIHILQGIRLRYTYAGIFYKSRIVSKVTLSMSYYIISWEYGYFINLFRLNIILYHRPQLRTTTSLCVLFRTNCFPQIYNISNLSTSQHVHFIFFCVYIVIEFKGRYIWILHTTWWNT